MDPEKWYRIGKAELQEMLDSAADQAVTQGIALAQSLLRKWVRHVIRDAGMKLLGFLWKPLLLGALAALGWGIYELRNYM